MRMHSRTKTHKQALNRQQKQNRFLLEAGSKELLIVTPSLSCSDLGRLKLF